MGLISSYNPLAFTQRPVTCLVLAVYIGLLAGLLTVHHSVPPAPSRDIPISGVNLTEAWHDLRMLTTSFHPYNSIENDAVRSWLLARIHSILHENGIKYEKVTQRVPAVSNRLAVRSESRRSSPRVVVFDDLVSNATFTSSRLDRESVYFEGTNIVIYVQGSEDDRNLQWWNPHHEDYNKSILIAKRGVLVNAHYDSVSTGYGATDDGVGVVSILQLIRHYTHQGQQPKRGLIALLNNGEEDYLNGANAFSEHVASRFPNTFLNLEGAGAGGRATIFRSTDAEVTKSYGKSPYPFGTAVSADGFKQGLVRSGTDYSVFSEKLGLRGLDIAFMDPRSTYHTTSDSSRRTSKDSMWHMLSAALATTKSLTDDTDTDFSSGQGTQAVYFDLFGRAFIVTSLHILFAASVTLLVVAPIVLIIVAFTMYHHDRWYLFSRKATSDSLDPHAPDEPVEVSFGGWRGFSRYPVAFVLASAAIAALALLITRFNPYIVYSSPYAVWSMMLSTWVIVAWFVLRGADYMRPSALHRAQALGWLFAISWVLLVGATVGEHQFKIASSYLSFCFNITTFAALLISYMEFIRLPQRSEYALLASHEGLDGDSHPCAASTSSRRPRSSGTMEAPTAGAEATTSANADETTSLLRSRSAPRRNGGSRSGSRDSGGSERRKSKTPYGNEQPWSGSLPSWLWTLQFLLLGPINIILFGQVALILISALSQTPADGSPVSTVYASMTGLSILLLLPTSPFIHRLSSRVPAFLFFVFVGTLVYNLIAFPFSEHNRLKVFFQQKVNLDTGVNNVSLTGLDHYVQQIAAEMPSAAGQALNCTTPELASRRGLTTCSWIGLPPNVVSSDPVRAASHDYASWVTLNASRVPLTACDASFRLSGLNTRACKLQFDSPLADFNVTGAAPHDPRYVKVPDNGTYELRLWSREWDRTWDVNVRLKDAAASFTGRAVCLWSDQNDEAAIPALTEVRKSMPVWSIVTKFGDGLVEGSKGFAL